MKPPQDVGTKLIPQHMKDVSILSPCCGMETATIAVREASAPMFDRVTRGWVEGRSSVSVMPS